MKSFFAPNKVNKNCTSNLNKNIVSIPLTFFFGSSINRGISKTNWNVCTNQPKSSIFGGLSNTRSYSTLLQPITFVATKNMYKLKFKDTCANPNATTIIIPTNAYESTWYKNKKTSANLNATRLTQFAAANVLCQPKFNGIYTQHRNYFLCQVPKTYRNLSCYNNLSSRTSARFYSTNGPTTFKTMDQINLYYDNSLCFSSKTPLVTVSSDAKMEGNPQGGVRTNISTVSTSSVNLYNSLKNSQNSIFSVSSPQIAEVQGPSYIAHTKGYFDGGSHTPASINFVVPNTSVNDLSKQQQNEFSNDNFGTLSASDSIDSIKDSTYGNASHN